MDGLKIYSDKTLIDNKLVPALLDIRNGKIEAISYDKPNDATNLIDVGNDILMPGLIDPHVHINEPGRTDWEGFETATKAAAAGGLTSLIDMPLNSSPVTTSVEAYREKINATKGKLHVNCGFWAGLVPDNSENLTDLLDTGVLGIKAFMTHSGIDEFPNVTRQNLEAAMPEIAKRNLPLLLHCELDKDHEGIQHLLENPTSYQKYLHSRPRSWEDNAIELMIELCEKYQCRTHIVHLSSSNSIEAIIKAKAKKLPLTVETAQHYLYFNSESILDGRTEFKCAPPIREEENNKKLLKALLDGTIDFVGTDHSPAPPDLKEIQSGNFAKAWGGIAGLQFALPVLWTVASKSGASVLDIHKWMSANVAKFVGLDNSKGKIKIGYDADLLVWNPDENFLVTASQIQHRHKVCPYIGENLKGVVKKTIVNGKIVFDEGRFVNLKEGKIL